MRQDRWLTLRELTLLIFDISVTPFYEIRGKKIVVSENWRPKMLTEERKRQSVMGSQGFLSVLLRKGKIC